MHMIVGIFQQWHSKNSSFSLHPSRYRQFEIEERFPKYISERKKKHWNAERICKNNFNVLTYRFARVSPDTVLNAVVCFV
jgi:hypothetical protein